MTWIEFSEKYHVRQTDKCCDNCKHGEDDYDGCAKCRHPYLDDGGSGFSGACDNSVCDLWEARRE